MDTTSFKRSWLPDVPDVRDVPYSSIRPQNRLLRSIARPRYVYHREIDFPEVYNQGMIGSCVGHGVANVCSYAVGYNLLDDDTRPPDLSRLFLYYIARRNKRADEGAYIREGIKAVAKYGAPLEEDWPYVESRFSANPPKEVWKEASKRAVGVRYYRLADLGDILDCVAQGFPVVYGMMLYESFDRVGSDGKVSMPLTRERATGGHCMTIIGYNGRTREFYVRNSWGKNWGSRGHCWVPYAYIEGLADDFWTVRWFVL
jgi:C1A family cysteine protease